jgi:Thioredoxin-like
VCPILFGGPEALYHKPGSRRYIPVTRYDPKRDPDADLAKALAEAKRTGRNVLMVGGDWCDWCQVMDKFFAAHADVRAGASETS